MNKYLGDLCEMSEFMDMNNYDGEQLEYIKCGMEAWWKCQNGWFHINKKIKGHFDTKLKPFNHINYHNNWWKQLYSSVAT